MLVQKWQAIEIPALDVRYLFKTEEQVSGRNLRSLSGLDFCMLIIDPEVSIKPEEEHWLMSRVRLH